jgi:homoserine acetyltransferase
MNKKATALQLGLLLAALAAAAGAEEQQFAPIGDLQLEHGGVIRDCVLGYRSFGTLKYGP